MENQQKLNLFKVRDFGENFEMILSFLKQNYGPILKGICYVIPIMLIVTYFLQPLQGLQNRIATLDDIEDMQALFMSFQIMIAMILYAAVSIAVSIYPVCYMVEYSKSENGIVEIKDVWNRVKSVFIPLLVASILFALALVVGFVLCVIPGFIVLVYCIFYQFVYVAEHESITGCFSRSWNLVRDNWWMMFAFGVIFGILMFIVGLILSIPVSASSILVLLGSNSFITEIYLYIANLISYVGQLMLAPISTIAIGVLYFSRRSDVDNIEINEDIYSIGSTDNDQNRNQQY